MATNYIDNMESKTLKAPQEISWAELKQMTISSTAPFQVTLNESSEVLYCQKVIRIIPEKRLVAYGTWGGQAVVAKLFYEKGRSELHAKRDSEGIKALHTAGVLTPALNYIGSTQDKKIQVLLFEQITHALSLDEIWRLKSSVAEILLLLHAMTIELATQHVLGVTQKDLHFKNFLIRKKKIYTLDGGDVNIVSNPLPKKESIENLALFFAQFGVGAEELHRNLFQCYVKARGWIVKKQDLKLLEVSVKNYQEQRVESYEKKIMRTCSAFVCHKTATNLTLYSREYDSPAFQQVLKNPEIALVAQGSEILKAGRSTTVAEIMIDNRPVVMKRYNIKDFGHQLRRCLRPTRAAKNWRLGHVLNLLGIPTAKPIAFIEKRFLGLRSKSYLFMESIAGVNLGEYFSNNMNEPLATLVVAKEVMSLFENLAKLRITHGDLKMTNILISKQKPILIDLDGMCEHSTQSGFKRAFRQEMERFMANWHNQPMIYKMFEMLIEEMFRRLNLKSYSLR